MKYTGVMDKECIELCDTLNTLPGVKTCDSCCGHLKDKYRIFMTISNFYSISLLARAFDHRYSSGKWIVYIDSGDMTQRKVGVAIFILESTEIFKTQEEMEKYITEAINNIKYWQDKKFKKYLKGIE